jgi:hypothetical protein
VRILVLLDINGLGTDLCDAAEMAAALRALGHEPLVLVRGPRRSEDGASAPRGVMPWPGLREFGRIEREFQPDCVVRADAGQGQWYWRLAGALGGIPARAWTSTGVPPTNWGVDPLRARRSRLALWDGDYVLCPTAADPACGAALLAGFARLGEEHPQLDLVLLADPQKHLVRLAEGLEIAARVHFAGCATRDAEWSWLEHAGAVAMLPNAPVSTGLLLRSWAVGRPPITCHGLPCAVWVDPGRTGWCCQPDASSLARALREALTPGPALRFMMDVSRALAAERTWERAARALDSSLRELPPQSVHAAAPPEAEPRERAA